MAGGFLSTFLPSGSDIPWPGPIRRMFPATGNESDEQSKSRGKRSELCHLGAHILRNTIAGGLAAFILWSGHNVEVDFRATDPKVFTVGFAASIGLAGTAVVNSLAKRTSLSNDRGDMLERAAQGMRELAEQGEEEESEEDEVAN